MKRIEASSSIRRLQNEKTIKVGSIKYINSYNNLQRPRGINLDTTQDDNRPIVAHEVVIM